MVTPHHWAGRIFLTLLVIIAGTGCFPLHAQVDPAAVEQFLVKRPDIRDNIRAWSGIADPVLIIREWLWITHEDGDDVRAARALLEGTALPSGPAEGELSGLPSDQPSDGFGDPAEGGEAPAPVTAPAEPGPVPASPESLGSGATRGAEGGDGTPGGALTWAADQLPGGNLNGYNRNNRQHTRDGNTVWDNWCLAFVSTAFGRQKSLLCTGSAIAAYNNCNNAGKIVRDRHPPAGAVMFQNTTSSNSWGHIFLATGETDASGDPIVITTGWPGFSGIHRISLHELERRSPAQYLGWCLP